MGNAILSFPYREADRPSFGLSHPFGTATEPPVPTHQLWRRVPAKAFGDAERAALQVLLEAARPLRVEHWREALAGDDAAAVAMALKLCGIDVLDSYRHDLVLSMLIWHALKDSEAAKSTLAFTLDRRRYLGEDVEDLTRSWRGPSRADIRRAAVQALVEALS